jgi:hypothetical protein
MKRYGWRNSPEGHGNGQNGEDRMQTENQKKNEPIPQRMEALRELPGEVLRHLTKSEIKAFLFEEVWPDSLKEKLKDYLA